MKSQKSFLDRHQNATSPRSGQAIIEYVLLVVITSLIFSVLFGIIRQNVFELWVCQIYPRIGAMRGCSDNTDDCWAQLERDTDGVVSKFPQCQ